MEQGILTHPIPTVELPIREQAVVRLLALGTTHAKIAEMLKISHATVDLRRKRAMQRVGATNTAALIHYAIMSGLVGLGEPLMIVADEPVQE